LSSASGAFTDAFDACLERDQECIDACRFQLGECRDSTGAGADLFACQLELKAAKDRCRNKFPLGSRRREICIDRAQIAGFRCRRAVLRHLRRALRDCRSAFGQCANACVPGGPPGGVDTCKADAKAALQADLASCKATYQVTASGCINKDVTCVQGCGDARDACSAPTQSMLAAAMMACTAQEKAAAAACVQANPGGGSALDQCLTTAQANAFACREAALEAAREFPARRVRVRADSQLLVRQLEGRYRVKQAHLRPYFERARELLAEYEEVELTHVPREQNTEADALVNAALDLA